MGVTTEFTNRVAGSVRAELARLGLDGVSLTQPLGLSRNSVYARLRGAKPFTTDEIERVAEFLGVEIAQIVMPGANEARMAVAS